MLARFRLSARQRRALIALAPVICTDAVRGLEERLADEVELFLRSVPAHVRLALLTALGVFDASARLVPSSWLRSFARLDPARAERHFARFWHSPVGLLHHLARGLKMIVSYAYYELPEVKARLGYDPDAWIDRVRRERLARWADDVAAHDRLVLAPDPLRPAGPGPAPAGRVAAPPGTARPAPQDQELARAGR